jgi:hypothetical protein
MAYGLLYCWLEAEGRQGIRQPHQELTVMSEQQAQRDSSNEFADQLIRVPDVDAAIYRIFPLWFLEEALRLRQLVLVTPSS